MNAAPDRAHSTRLSQSGRSANNSLPITPPGVGGEGESLMTEEHGRYDRRPPPPRRRSSGPEALRDLLRRYVEDRRWDHLLAPSNSNGHRPTDRTTVRRRDG